jgi:hypothetical protein
MRGDQDAAVRIGLMLIADTGPEGQEVLRAVVHVNRALLSPLTVSRASIPGIAHLFWLSATKGGLSS